MARRSLQCRTSSLEEKATACNMLCCYADELKEGFMPYVKPVRQGNICCVRQTGASLEWQLASSGGMGT